MMKNLKMLIVGIGLALMPFLQSCDDNEGYSVDSLAAPVWATVHASDGAFYVQCDSWGSMWPINQNLTTGTGSYQPKDGQRAIVTFSPVGDEFQGYDHAIRILNMQEILTKNLETVHPENESDFGNDPITIYKGNLWVSENHLNIIFHQNVPAQEKHQISLVRPASDDELYGKDGYIHLQLRYDDKDDLTGYRMNGAVSFSLKDLEITESTKGIKLDLHSEANGKVVVELPFAAQP